MIQDEQMLMGEYSEVFVESLLKVCANKNVLRVKQINYLQLLLQEQEGCLCLHVLRGKYNASVDFSWTFSELLHRK